MQLSETAVRHDRDQTRVQAGWFGDERSLFGWLHLPAGKQARGGVVLFPRWPTTTVWPTPPSSARGAVGGLRPRSLALRLRRDR